MEPMREVGAGEPSAPADRLSGSGPGPADYPTKNEIGGRATWLPEAPRERVNSLSPAQRFYFSNVEPLVADGEHLPPTAASWPAAALSSIAREGRRPVWSKPQVHGAVSGSQRRGEMPAGRLACLRLSGALGPRRDHAGDWTIGLITSPRCRPRPAASARAPSTGAVALVRPRCRQRVGRRAMPGHR